MVEFAIGQTVERTDLNGDKVVRKILTEEDIVYHGAFQKQGYKYTVLSVNEPPKVYTGDSVCVSCEG